MKVTLDSILFTQSPALFLAAVLLIISYFVRRANHHARAVLDLLLGFVCVALGVALYYLGMLNGLFTIKDFWHLRTPAYVGRAIVVLLAVILILRSIKQGIQRHQAERKANRVEAAHQKELEEVRQQAFASGQAAARAEVRATPAGEEPAAPPEQEPVENRE